MKQHEQSHVLNVQWGVDGGKLAWKAGPKKGAVENKVGKIDWVRLGHGRGVGS